MHLSPCSLPQLHAAFTASCLQGFFCFLLFSVAVLSDWCLKHARDNCYSLCMLRVSQPASKTLSTCTCHRHKPIHVQLGCSSKHSCTPFWVDFWVDLLQQQPSSNGLLNAWIAVCTQNKPCYIPYCTSTQSGKHKVQTIFMAYTSCQTRQPVKSLFSSSSSFSSWVRCLSSEGMSQRGSPLKLPISACCVLVFTS